MRIDRTGLWTLVGETHLVDEWSELVLELEDLVDAFLDCSWEREQTQRVSSGRRVEDHN